METIEITLPLQPTASRCLGHWSRPGEWCPKRAECARHETIHHPTEPWAEVEPPMYRGCVDLNFPLLMEFKK